MPYPGTALFPQSTGLYPGDAGADLPPSVTTGAASSITTTTALLAGSIDPNDFQTHYFFQYGGDTFEQTSATWVAGTAPVNVSRTISGLTSATHYHFRLVAYSAAGTTYGLGSTFATDFSRDDRRVLLVHTADRAQ